MIQVGKIPWRRKWQPTPVFLPVESHPHGRRSLVGYSPWGNKEEDTAELLTLPLRTITDRAEHKVGTKLKEERKQDLTVL